MEWRGGPSQFLAENKWPNWSFSLAFLGNWWPFWDGELKTWPFQSKVGMVTSKNRGWSLVTTWITWRWWFQRNVFGWFFYHENRGNESPNVTSFSFFSWGWKFHLDSRWTCLNIFDVWYQISDISNRFDGTLPLQKGSVTMLPVRECHDEIQRWSHFFLDQEIPRWIPFDQHQGYQFWKKSFFDNRKKWLVIKLSLLGVLFRCFFPRMWAWFF